MSKYKIVVRDTIELQPAQVADQNKVMLKDFDLSNQSLVIKVAATHAGRVTKNNGFYLPDKMQKGVETFTKDFQKPVLTHHDDRQDPIGRVVAARYVDTSDKAKQILLKQDTRGDLLKRFLALNDSKVPFIKKVDILQDYGKVSALLDNEAYEGLGYAEVTARISDPEAIKKVRDGRYLTVSIGASSDRAVCSVCSQDWSEEGRCSHAPGAHYKKNDEGEWMEDESKTPSVGRVKCFLVYGELFYDEFSFINRPADTIAKVIEIQNDAGAIDSIAFDKEDFEKVVADYFVSNLKSQTMINLSDSTQTNLLDTMKEEETMTDKVKEEEQPSAEGAQNSDKSEKGLIDQFVDGSLKIDSVKERQLVVSWHDSLHYQFDPYNGMESKLASEVANRMSTADKELHAKLHKLAIDDGFREDFRNGPLDSTLELFGVKDPEQPGEYSEEDATKEKDPKEADVKDETVEGSEASESTTPAVEPEAQPTGDTQFDFETFDLDKLSDKDFAEKNRDVLYDLMIAEMESAVKDGAVWHRRNGEQFSVEDAKLSTAQRKKLGSSTFCGPNRSFPVPDCAHVTAARRLIGRFKAGESTKAKVLSCVNRKARALGCDASTSRDAYSEEKIESLSDKQLEQLYRQIDTELVKRDICPLAPELEENTKLHKQVEELEDRIDALKKELELAWRDAEEAQSRSAEILQERHRSKAVQLVDFKLLAGETVEDYEQAVSVETEKSSEVLDSLVKEYRDKTDLSKISAKLNDGTARIPKGVVQDPTTSTEDVESGTESSEKAKAQKEADAREVYVRFKQLSLKSLNGARRFYQTMESRGFITQDLFNKFEQETNKIK